jgi:hypothetical protein
MERLGRAVKFGVTMWAKENQGAPNRSSRPARETRCKDFLTRQTKGWPNQSRTFSVPPQKMRLSLTDLLGVSEESGLKVFAPRKPAAGSPSISQRRGHGYKNTNTKVSYSNAFHHWYCGGLGHQRSCNQVDRGAIEWSTGGTQRRSR